MLNIDNIIEELHEGFRISDTEKEKPIQVDGYNRNFNIPEGYNTTLGYVGDVQSQIVTFKLPLTHEEHFLYKCNHKEISWKNLGTGISGVTELVDDEVGKDGFLLTWKVPSELFTGAGSVEISISLYDLYLNKPIFSWNTASQSLFFVKANSQSISEKFLPPKTHILNISEETRSIVASAGFNRVVANYGDVHTSTLYFQVNRFIGGIDLLSNSVQKFILFTAPTTDGEKVFLKSPLKEIESQFYPNQLTFYWEIPVCLTCTEGFDNFDIAIQFVDATGSFKETLVEVQYGEPEQSNIDGKTTIITTEITTEENVIQQAKPKTWGTTLFSNLQIGNGVESISGDFPVDESNSKVYIISGTEYDNNLPKEPVYVPGVVSIRQAEDEQVLKDKNPQNFELFALTKDKTKLVLVINEEEVLSLAAEDEVNSIKNDLEYIKQNTEFETGFKDFGSINIHFQKGSINYVRNNIVYPGAMDIKGPYYCTSQLLSVFTIPFTINLDSSLKGKVETNICFYKTGDEYLSFAVTTEEDSTIKTKEVTITVDEDDIPSGATCYHIMFKYDDVEVEKNVRNFTISSEGVSCLESINFELGGISSENGSSIETLKRFKSEFLRYEIIKDSYIIPNDSTKYILYFYDKDKVYIKHSEQSTWLDEQSTIKELASRVFVDDKEIFYVKILAKRIKLDGNDMEFGYFRNSYYANTKTFETLLILYKSNSSIALKDQFDKIQGKIETNTQKIETNTQKIETNTQKIETNTQDIAKINTNIDSTIASYIAGLFQSAEIEMPENNPSVKNAVDNFYQLINQKWTSIAPIPQRYNAFNRAGTYTGIPYSSTRQEGLFVPNNVSFYTFLTALKNPNSYLYTVDLGQEPYHNTNGKTYYGTVCSLAAGHALQIPENYSTHQWQKIAGMYAINEQSVNALEIGDTIVNKNYAGGHVVMVTGIKKNAFGVTDIEISESCNNTCQKNWYTAEQLITGIYSKGALTKQGYPPNEYIYCRYKKLEDNGISKYDIQTDISGYEKTFEIIPRKGDKSVWVYNRQTIRHFAYDYKKEQMNMQESIDIGPVLDVISDPERYTYLQIQQNNEDWAEYELEGKSSIQLEELNSNYAYAGNYKARLAKEQDGEKIISEECSWHVLRISKPVVNFITIEGKRYLQIEFSHSDNTTPKYVVWSRGDGEGNIKNKGTIHITTKNNIKETFDEEGNPIWAVTYNGEDTYSKNLLVRVACQDNGGYGMAFSDFSNLINYKTEEITTFEDPVTAYTLSQQN